ncbi:Wzz/FepE/Etk N-terminal domain-containing protein [Rhizobium sp. TRM95796]|uniref:Wzz/FepE/Etk N-terminal domain-containing protein n=1 Tax=Rhizobium sp. TRM95796 TaxID=2979862 RepID=UPI0021E808EC|nr:Wzz/FepE/Etk N-terminal domain-containing protein [Rhizobium sp. TRM95796]MCV3764166.1 Wzz/FepE/Etk N-terminal domain-containing protein [Rhizobium sp. TRM95796]
MANNAASSSDIHVLEQLAGIFRRRWKGLAVFTILGLAAGGLYAASQPPRYSAAATVMVRSGFAVDPLREGAVTTTPEEEGQFLSQMELAKSTTVLRAAAAKMSHLDELLGYTGVQPSLLDQLLGQTPLARYHVQLGEAAAGDEIVLSALRNGVSVTRQGRTYVASIGFTHGNPDVAKEAASAVAVAFTEVLKQISDAANARIRSTIEAELATAAGPARDALAAKLQDVTISRALPGVDAVIISDARQPGAPIAPRKGFLLAVGAILGAALGCLFAAWREMRDRGFRDGDALARSLGVRFLGYMPVVPKERRRAGSTTVSEFSLPAGARRSVDQPYNRFAETLRSAGVAALPAPGDKARVIGVTSVLPGEGKTVVAANLAAQLANQGRRVLLVDGHLRDPDLTNWLAGRPAGGIVDAVMVDAPLDQAALFDRKSNLTLLPVGEGRKADPAALWTGEKFREFLAKQAGEHDIVILDFPAIAAVSDASAIAPVVDGFLLVAEWGGAPADLIASVLAGEPAIKAKLLGVVVSKTRLGKLSRYVSGASRGAYQHRIG